MTDADVTGREVLRRAYGTGRDLSARQSLYQWQRPRYDLPGLVLDRVPATARLVVDVGCGNGRFLTRLLADRPEAFSAGVDVATGILREVPGPVVVGDAARLPFRSQVADVVLAMHMLYHVHDIPAALAEMVRVLRPGGVLIASTNARDDKAELDELWAAAAADVLGVADPPRRVSLSARFALDDAVDVLAGHLDAVELIELPGVIAVDDPEPVVAHLASYRAWADQLGVPFDATIARARTLLDRRLARDGEFRIRCRGGVLIGHAPAAKA